MRPPEKTEAVGGGAFIGINVRAQFVAGDASSALDFEHALDRDTSPLRNGLRRDLPVGIAEQPR